MDLVTLLAQLTDGVRRFWEDSLIVAIVKFFLMVYALVLLADIILLLYLRDLLGDVKKAFWGGKQPLLSQGAAEKRWQKITGRLESNSLSQFKVAILEADAFASDILSSIGYPGKSMQEQLDRVIDGQLQSKETLQAAHQMRNRIIHEADLTLDREETEKWLKLYQHFFREIDLLSA